MSIIWPRTVLMTADNVGGVWSYSLELARALGERGASVALAVMGLTLSADQRAEARALPNLQVYESEYKLEWMPDAWTEVEAAGEWLLDLERATAPEVIHLNGYAHGSLNWKAPVLVVGHSCVTSWWQAIHGTQPPREWDEYRLRVRAGLQGADLVAAPSHAMLRCLEEHYGPLQRRVVIPNGRSIPERGHVAKEPFIFSAGRLWDAAKNIAALDEIAGELPWPVYVAGEDWAEGGKGARRLGRISAGEVFSWLQRATIYALPARYEPFGLSVLEAALSKCALVLGDIPSLRENWDGAAIFVPPQDRKALRFALQQLIEHPVEAAALGTRAAEVAAQFTSARMVAGYLAAYRQLGAGGAEAASIASPMTAAASLPAQTPTHQEVFAS